MVLSSVHGAAGPLLSVERGMAEREHGTGTVSAHPRGHRVPFGGESLSMTRAARGLPAHWTPAEVGGASDWYPVCAGYGQPVTMHAGIIGGERIA